MVTDPGTRVAQPASPDLQSLRTFSMCKCEIGGSIRHAARRLMASTGRCNQRSRSSCGYPNRLSSALLVRCSGSVKNPSRSRKVMGVLSTGSSLSSRIACAPTRRSRCLGVTEIHRARPLLTVIIPQFIENQKTAIDRRAASVSVGALRGKPDSLVNCERFWQYLGAKARGKKRAGIPTNSGLSVRS